MINRALKVIRQFHQLKQVELAIDLGISKSYLSEIESGKKLVSMDILQRYSDIFDIPASSLVFFSESMEKEGQIPKRFRTVFASKIIDIMEWLTKRNESKEAKI